MKIISGSVFKTAFYHGVNWQNVQVKNILDLVILRCFSFSKSQIIIQDKNNVSVVSFLTEMFSGWIAPVLAADSLRNTSLILFWENIRITSLNYRYVFLILNWKLYLLLSFQKCTLYFLSAKWLCWGCLG